MTGPACRSLAVVPAAGFSRRMGTAKLLLPLGGQTIIEVVLRNWCEVVDRVAVVVRQDDPALIDRCRSCDVDLVCLPSATPDMKATVWAGLEHFRTCYDPQPADCWLLAPADMPLLTSRAIAEVLAAYDPAHPRILLASHRGRAGHPVLLPWSLAAEVCQLGASEGMCHLIARHTAVHVECHDSGVLSDLDTPEDYRVVLDRVQE